MKVFNLAPVVNEQGQKVLHLNIFGVIAQGFFDTVDAAEIAQLLQEHKDAAEIVQHINSIGGDVFDGIAILNLVLGHGAPVTSIVEGLAASAASIVAMAGRTVMGEGAMMMIHNPWTVVAGDAKELRRMAADLDKVRESLITVYRNKTGKDAQELKALLDAETLMTAEQAKRNGFADEISADAETTVEARGENLFFNHVAFPRERLPEGAIMALAKPPAPGNPTPPTPVEAPQNAATNPPEGVITREILAAKAPEIVAALQSEARAAGVAEERQRIRDIEELGLKGCDDLVFSAKFEKPIDHRDLAVMAVRAGKQAGADILAAREREGAPLNSVQPSTPEGSDALGERAKDERLIRAIVGDKPKNGGVR